MLTCRNVAAPGLWIVGVCLWLTACHTQILRTVDVTPPARITQQIPETQLLDIGVAVFDPNVPEEYDEREDQLVNEEVRRAESYYMPYVLKSVLESTGNWGAVRVIPQQSHAVDVVVSGKILVSHGERLVLEAQVKDAGGIVWFTKTYEALASKYAYQESLPPGVDPFQHTYTQIADDMAARFITLTEDERRDIRRTAEMQFARNLVPMAYGDYLQQSPSGETMLKRLPAEDDPLMRKIRKVRDREFMFVDTLDGYYADYNRRIYRIYQTWRQATYDEAIEHLKISQQNRKRGVAGTLSLVGGLVGGPAAWSGIGTGAEMLRKNIRRTDDVQMHADALREVSASMEGETAPHTLELENRTVELTGSVDEQYANLRRVLRDSYIAEFYVR